jgi:ribosomal protein S18 acetylase RimI-like enzyme
VRSGAAFTTEQPLSLRPYEPGDAAFVARLAKQVFLEYTPVAVEHTLELVQRFTSRVAVRAGRRVGFMAAEVGHGDRASLHAIAVSESERGRGVGRRLLLSCEQLARQRGAKRLELCTADSNVAALDLFLKCGFRLERRRSRFYARGQNACILVKDLS